MDELVQATRPCHGGIQDIRAIRRADHKHVLLTHGVDREDLDWRSPPPSRLNFRIALAIESISSKNRIRGSRASVEQADVRLGLAEPHRQQFRPFHGDEVRPAFIGNLGNEFLHNREDHKTRRP